MCKDNLMGKSKKSGGAPAAAPVAPGSNSNKLTWTLDESNASTFNKSVMQLNDIINRDSNSLKFAIEKYNTYAASSAVPSTAPTDVITAITNALETLNSVKTVSAPAPSAPAPSASQQEVHKYLSDVWNSYKNEYDTANTNYNSYTAAVK